MKICHLTSVHKHNDTRIFVKECCSLAENGYEVYLIAPNAPNTMENGVHLVGVGEIKGNRFKRMTKTVAEVYKKALEIDADVYHFHDPELIKVGLKLLKKGKKVIYDVHEDVPRQILSKNWIPKFIRPLISKIIEVYEDRSAAKFNAVIAATPHIKERFKKNNNNTYVITNYPSLKEMDFDSISWSQKENICYIGGIGTVRGAFEIVEMLSIVNKQTNLKLDLCGPIDTRIKDNLINLDEWSHVNYKGVLSKNEVKSVLKTSKAGLVTLYPIINYIDALPVKMFEYMAAGIPVIASDFPLWRSIIADANCGILVDPLDKKSIAEAVLQIISNKEMAIEMGINGRLAVEQKYNWESESIKLVEMYKNRI